MSASNYAVCPRCTRRAQKAAQDALAKAQEAYGQVGAGEYERLRSEAQELFQATPGYKFREDYEVYGADSGAVVVSYGGSCEACGLSVSFTHTVPIPGVAE